MVTFDRDRRHVHVRMKDDEVMVDDVDDALGLDGDAVRVKAAALFDGLYGLAFSRDNLEMLAPRYTAYGLPVPSSGREVTWEEEARRMKSVCAYRMFNAVKPDAKGKWLKKK